MHAHGRQAELDPHLEPQSRMGCDDGERLTIEQFSEYAQLIARRFHLHDSEFPDMHVTQGGDGEDVYVAQPFMPGDACPCLQPAIRLLRGNARACLPAAMLRRSRWSCARSWARSMLG